MMLSFALRLIAGAGAFYLADYLLWGLWCRSLEAALLAGACLMLLHLTIRPLARVVLFAFNLLTLGLINLAIDTTLILVIIRLFPNDIKVKSLFWAVAAALIVSLVRAVTGKLVSAS